VIVELVTLPPTPPAAHIALGEIDTGRFCGNALTVTVVFAVPVQPLPPVTTTVTVAVPLVIPNRIVAWLAVVLWTVLPAPLTLQLYVTPLVGVAVYVAVLPLQTADAPLTLAVICGVTVTFSVLV